MSLFETLTSLDDGDFKLFEDDPFLLDPDDSSNGYIGCDDVSDEADSLTGSLSSPFTLNPCHRRRHNGINSIANNNSSRINAVRQAVRPICRRIKEEPVDDVPQPEIITEDVSFEVHNYCIGSSSSIRSLSASCPSPSSTAASLPEIKSEIVDEEDDGLEDKDTGVECDELDGLDDEEEEEDTVKSSSCSVTSNSPTTTRRLDGHLVRRKSLLDKSLSEEEKRLLMKEGYTNFPENGNLTKSDEKVLRKIRRKIRNKKSAQCSRQRKKEYVEELEKKYQKCTNDNLSLKKEVMKLRRENACLSSKIKNLMSSGAEHLTSGQASFKTSFFVLCLSFLLILFPFMTPDAMLDDMTMMAVGKESVGPGRHLLMASNFSPLDALNDAGSHYVSSAINSSASDHWFSISS